MVHKNIPAEDIEFLCVFTGYESGLPTGGTQFKYVSAKEFWGDAGTAGIFCDIKSSWAVPEYICTFTSPAGTSFSTGVVGVLLTSGSWRVKITNYQLVVNNDCSYTVSWDALDAYLIINGGTEVLEKHHGSYTYSGSAGTYDESLNATIGSVLDVKGIAPSEELDCADTPVTITSGAIFNGGYRRWDSIGSVWIYDPVLVDIGDTDALCTNCYYPLPDLWDLISVNSYSVIIPALFNLVISDGSHHNYHCVCLGGGEVTGYWYRKVLDWYDVYATTVYIKDKRVPLPDEETITDWHCTDDGTPISGGDDVIDTPVYFTCASERYSEREVIDIYCDVREIHPCAETEEGGTGCEGVPPVPDPNKECHYSGSRKITHPTKAPCTSTKRVVNHKHQNKNHYTNMGNNLHFRKENAPVYQTKVFTQELIDAQPEVKDDLYVLLLDGGDLKLETKLGNAWSGLYMTIATDVDNGALHIIKGKTLIFAYTHTTSNTLRIKTATLSPVAIIDTTITNITDVKHGSEVKLNSYTDIISQLWITVTYINTSNAFIYMKCKVYDFTNWV